ncbi:MAG: HD domain-containing phosphohydrolase [Solirubrobacteraceae bacterium]
MIEGRTEPGPVGLAESVVTSGYASLVLDRLARQACELVGADASCVLVRDRWTPGTTIAVAGYGRDEEIVGDRFGESGDWAGGLDLSNPVHADSPAASPVDQPRRAHVAVPICRDGEVFGALTAGAAARRSFGNRELAVLSDIAALAGAAVAHAEQRSEILPRARARVLALVKAIDARDGYTATHADTVVRLSRALGRRLRLSPLDLLELELAALLHDLGKLAIPDAILKKPAPLDRDEQILMRQHPEWGAAILTHAPGLQAVATIVRCHHEWWDGTGYPSRLAGKRIPIASRIVAICDAYDAMTSDRCYRKALPRDSALEEMRSAAGAQFDPTLVKLLPAILKYSVKK